MNGRYENGSQQRLVHVVTALAGYELGGSRRRS